MTTIRPTIVTYDEALAARAALICSVCDGAGRVHRIDRPSTNTYECPRCRGTGDEPRTEGDRGPAEAGGL